MKNNQLFLTKDIDWDQVYEIGLALNNIPRDNRLSWIEQTKRELLKKSIRHANKFIDYLEYTQYCFPLTARKKQLISNLDFNTCLILAGRGFGKSLTGSHWIKDLVYDKNVSVNNPFMVVGPTLAQTIEANIKGSSGIMNAFPQIHKPSYNSTTKELQFHNGKRAKIYTSETPEIIRGANLSAVYVDEVAAWHHNNVEDTWAQINFACRTGNPKILITTTPQSKTPQHYQFFKKRLEEAQDPRFNYVIIRGTTHENQNLSNVYLDKMSMVYDNTRIGRQEIYGELLEDDAKQFFPRSVIEKNKIDIPMNDRSYYDKVVIAVDPAGTSSQLSDETGIIIAGRRNGKAYILADYSGRYKPVDWISLLVTLFAQYKANSLVVETNYGADILINSIKTQAPHLYIEEVKAKHGKELRAHPVSALYEQGKVFHPTGNKLKDLEAQMEVFPGEHDDRVDGLVYAVTNLLIPDVQYIKRDFGSVRF